MTFATIRAAAVVTGILVGVGASAQEVYVPGNGVSAPVLVKSVQPTYTAEAKEHKLEGLVGLTAVVQMDGRVGDVSVRTSLDQTYGLDRQAVEALKLWEFKPGMKDGRPVPVRISVELTFTLR
ncbi:MAG: energy transducer TonB [Candidatus Rokubacteria bacterium]|nr:energy transducer TonB [Candidatus Rokubacteria bacterium]